ncbi:MAG: hypothetical protein ACR2L9_13580 [Solirubrobacteraceae bacterium]
MSEPESDEAGGSAKEREREAEALAQQAEEQADELERRSGQLQDEVGAVREDWRRKRADPSIPGAPLPEEDAGAQTDRSSGPDAPAEDADED